MNRWWASPVLTLGLVVSSSAAFATSSQSLNSGVAAALPEEIGSSGEAHARERAWSMWQQSVDAVWRRWRVGDLTEDSLPGFGEEMGLLPSALVAAGVLPPDDDHAWTVGCSDFASALSEVLGKTVSPVGLEQWKDWRAVHRVMCGPLEDEETGLQQALMRMPVGMLPASPPVPWEVLLLEDVPSPLWECMSNQVPSALKQGLDRHEGLKWVARHCGADPALVFGQAQRCSGCLGHPRQLRVPLFRTWAWVRVPEVRRHNSPIGQPVVGDDGAGD